MSLESSGASSRKYFYGANPQAKGDNSSEFNSYWTPYCSSTKPLCSCIGSRRITRKSTEEQDQVVDRTWPGNLFLLPSSPGTGQKRSGASNRGYCNPESNIGAGRQPDRTRRDNPSHSGFEIPFGRGVFSLGVVWRRLCALP